MHAIIYAAWKRMNEDEEFCEQVELYLPVFIEPESIYDDTKYPARCLAKCLANASLGLLGDVQKKALESYKWQSEGLSPDYIQKCTV